MKSWKQFSAMTKRFMVFLVLLVMLAGGIAIWLHEPQQVTEEAPVGEAVQEQAPPREVLLYFALSQEALLYPEQRQIEACDDEVACIEGLVMALAQGPEVSGGLVRVLPEGTRLHSVVVGEELVTLDFGPRLVNGHPGGSLSELLTVYALVDSIAANFPHLRQLQLLVDGQPRDTLKGHVDIRQPVKADFSWTRNPQEAELTVPVRGGEDG